MSELLMIEQRPGAGDAQPWILDELGRRMRAHDGDRRLSELHRGLMRHPGVRPLAAQVTREEVQRTLGTLHERDYLEALSRVSSRTPVLMAELAAPGMAADTPVCAGVARTALEGARTAIAAARRVLEGARFAYALCRPPGHHAGPGWLGGYCYLNNAACAVQTFREGDVKPVGIVDLDIHYPNGTSAIVASMDDTSLHSLHSSPVVNAPGGAAQARTPRERLIEFAEPPSEELYLAAVATAIDLLAQSASVLVVSLGYDTVKGDPHGCWGFTPEVFRGIGRLLAGSRLPVCVIQEGGYELGSLAACAEAFAGGLLEGPFL